MGESGFFLSVFVNYTHGNSDKSDTALTIHKQLLFLGKNAGEMGSHYTAVSLCCFPSTPMNKVFVTVALELVPAVITCLSV